MTIVGDLVAARLDRDGVEPAVANLVLAAFGGVDSVDRLLREGELPAVVADGAGPTPVGAYINSVAVEGFRGIGPRATLEVAPGPGLTLVVGRNGSGKSSFAEALEVAFTGDNQRWANRSAVWKEGWRNLHHPPTAIEVSLAVEGVSGATFARRTWEDNADLGDSHVEVQPHGHKKTTLAFLGWEDALTTHRPFLSYSELGSMLDEGPTKLHDAVSSVLGLEELPAAEKALKDARLGRERRQKAVSAQRTEILEMLETVEDDRARKVIARLRTTPMDLSTVEAIVTAPAESDASGELAVLSRLCGYSFPSADDVRASAAELRDARGELAELAGTQVDRLLRGASLLEEALRFREEFAETTCPICATSNVLTAEWAATAERQAKEQAAAASEARRAKARAEKALRAGRGLIENVPQAIRDARGLELVDVAPVIAAWSEWVGLADGDADELVERLEATAHDVRSALDALQAEARAETERRQDTWRPIALNLAAWLAEAREAQDNAAVVPTIKRAETWLKNEAVAIRNERFAPIAEEASALWKLLRQRSNVQLGRIELKGAGVARRVVLDVTVDDVPGAALGVMSQGELNALALSLFFPRATLEESPFRFIVIDDPVQSMDPAKVDGLAKVLERTAGGRQVIVFTHDDRLPEAIRRLGIDAKVIEVARAERSIIELRPALTPVERHVDDARAVVSTAELPDDVRARVVPGFCRLAVEAGCIDAVRRRRIGRGEPYAAVERLLESAQKMTTLASLALFDDPTRGGDVLGTINSKFGRRAADAFRRANEGAHRPVEGDLRELISESAKLARGLADSV